MTKLPDDQALLKLVRDGKLSNKEIAASFGVTVAAVSSRLAKLGIHRRPYSYTAQAILNAAFPTGEFKRTDYTQRATGRTLLFFLRWRLGEPDMPKDGLRRAKQMAEFARDNGVVLCLDPENVEEPWRWESRQPSDDCLIMRWPAEREKPKGPHLAALKLPDCDLEAEASNPAVGSAL
ncbi:hypothetical protein [Streptomyces werraensis]|uniref:hypothetical protein n=1 Tax=Streptomyces werraensis TaxID=68284 RepID=UPI0036FBC74F